MQFAIVGKRAKIVEFLQIYFPCKAYSTAYKVALLSLKIYIDVAFSVLVCLKVWSHFRDKEFLSVDLRHLHTLTVILVKKFFPGRSPNGFRSGRWLTRRKDFILDLNFLMFKRRIIVTTS